MSYKPYYTNGWKSGEAGGTPITPEALNHMEQGIEQAYSDLAAKSHGNHVPETQTASGKVFLRNDNTWQTVTPANIGAVPTTRTVNGKALSGNISLTASDVGAASSSHGNHVPATQTASSKVFLRNDNTWQTVTPANIGAVPTSRTVNGKALSGNISLTADNVGAVSFTSLWTNASPTSQFNAQVISKSLSGYDAVLIFARTHVNTGIYTGTNSSFLIHVGDDGLLFDAGETGSYLVTRKVIVYTNKIEFTSAKYPSAYAATNLIEGNKNLVPTAIYGVKW